MPIIEVNVNNFENCYQECVMDKFQDKVVMNLIEPVFKRFSL